MLSFTRDPVSLGRLHGPTASSELPAQPFEVMTPDVVACRSDDDIRVAQDLMGEMQVSRIVCLDENGELAGVISLSDIAQFGESAGVATTLREVTLREARI